MKQVFPYLMCLGLGACGVIPGLEQRERAGSGAGSAAVESSAASAAAEAGAGSGAGSEAIKPSALTGGAATPAALDTTTAAEKAEAAKPDAGGAKLGTTIASLGDVAESGFWLKTPLAKTAGKGRVEYPATGKSAQVDLIPIPGEAGAGSRISLSAMRLLGADLTDLPELVVYGP
ncbi:hypothetical protein [Roseovarius nubinhibens]|uniref:hypothetical protein n=1 Tax=Roseovarius nubinhibens TaxID=314263 RepID=UPI0030EE3C66